MSVPDPAVLREQATKAGDFFKSGLVGAAGAVGPAVSQFVNLDVVQQGVAMSQEAIDAAMNAAAGAATHCVELVRVEILRDFFQQLSMVIGSIAVAMFANLKAVWGHVAAIVALAWADFSVPQWLIFGFLGAAAVLLFASFMWLMFFTSSLVPDALRRGHENKSWKERKEESKRKIMAMKLIVQAGLSLYLPVSRAMMQLIVCERSMRVSMGELFGNSCTVPLEDDACSCSDVNNYGVLRLVAIVVMIAFTLGLPFYLYKQVQHNKPQGSREDPNIMYNADGEAVPYTDDAYAQDLATDVNQINSPFRSLYNKYERKWAFYKVFVCVMKLALVVPVILLVNSTVGQLTASLVLMAFWTGATVYSSPFISPLDDKMDLSGRIATLVTIALGLVDQTVSAGWLTLTTSIVGNVVLAVNTFFMVLCTCWGIAAVRRLFKSVTGRLEYSDTQKRIEGSAHEIVPHWNIAMEVKHRVWHRTWDASMLAEDPAVAERFAELQGITRDVGKQRIQSHFQHSTSAEHVGLRSWILQNLEGVDVYYDGDEGVLDGKNDSKTKFAKLYCHTYPFQAVLVFDDDDADDCAILFDDNLRKLADKNRDPEIMRRVAVRKRLRALARGDKVYFPFTRQETKRVADGTSRDSNGKETTHYSTVTVTMNYEWGSASIGARYKDKMAAGFKFALSMKGSGEARLPRTGRTERFHNTVSVGLHDAELSADLQYTETGGLARLLQAEHNANVIQENLPGLHQEEAAYRQDLAAQRTAKEAVLNPAFWLCVYDNDAATPRQVVDYFHFMETNPQMKELPEKHTDQFSALFTRMALLRAHPAAALWFVFWDDVWQKNNDMSAITKHKELLDPDSPTALAYRPLTKSELAKELEGTGLLGSSYRFITTGAIAALYLRMDELAAAKVANTVYGTMPAQPAGSSVSNPLQKVVVG